MLPMLMMMMVAVMMFIVAGGVGDAVVIPSLTRILQGQERKMADDDRSLQVMIVDGR